MVPGSNRGSPADNWMGGDDIKKWGAGPRRRSIANSQRRTNRQFWPGTETGAMSKRDTQVSQDNGPGNVRFLFEIRLKQGDIAEEQNLSLHLFPIGIMRQ